MKSIGLGRGDKASSEGPYNPTPTFSADETQERDGRRFLGILLNTAIIILIPTNLHLRLVISVDRSETANIIVNIRIVKYISPLPVLCTPKTTESLLVER